MNIFSSSSRRTSQRKNAHPALMPAQHRQATVNRFADAGTRSEPSKEGRFTTVLMAALFALPVTMIIGLVLLLVVAVVAYNQPDPDSLTTPLSLGVLGLTSVLGGLVAARRGGSRGLLCGFLSGLLFTLLILSLSLFFGDEARSQLALSCSPLLTWGLHIGVVFLEILGAAIGSHHRGKQPHGHHKKA